MATWFAQNSSVNIDSANQWNSAANGTGSALTWANLNPADILVANGKTGIVINVDFTCSLITNVATGGTAGGGFTMNAGRTITCDITTSSATCVSITAAGTCTINGNITGGTSGNAIYGVSFNNGATGVLNVVGNVTGGTVGTNLWGIAVLGGGTLNVTGTVTGGASGTACRGIGAQTTTGYIINITGNVVGAVSAGVALVNVQGSLFITGNASGPLALEIGTGTPTMQITGDIVCNTSSAVIGAGSGVLLHNGSVTQASVSSRGVFNSIIYRIHPSSNKTREYRTYNTTTYADSGSRTYYTGGIALGHPATSNVRSGTVYGASNEFTGTLAVPSPTLVAIGVATDNTVGSYSPTGGLDAAGVRAAIGLASANLDTQLAAIPSAVSNAAAVRTELATELARIDAAISSRLATTSYTAPDNATIGTISTNLGIVNTNVLSRLAATSYVAPLSASETRGALGLAAANLDTQLDNLPTNTEFNARTLLAADYATSAIQTAIKAVTDKINTGLVQDGAVYQFTANMLELAPGGGGGGSATLENQELILANLDNVTGAVSAAVARLQLETQITGFPATICRGSDYATTLESEIRLQLLDLEENPITEIGGTPVAEITWLFGFGTDRQPRLVSGACSWDGTTDELVIELDADDTATTPLGAVTWQIGAQIGELIRWLGGGTTRVIERQFA